MNKDEVYSILRDPNVFHYEAYLLENPNEDEVLLNTIELFSLGDIKHYIRYKDNYLELDELCIDKLLKLSLLTVLGKNIGNSLKLNEIMAELVIVNDEETLEDLIMSMVISNLIAVKINQNERSLQVEDVFVMRDAYNEDKVKLRVLLEEDVRGKSVKWARQILEAWSKQKIIPNQEQLLQQPRGSLDL